MRQNIDVLHYSTSESERTQIADKNVDKMRNDGTFFIRQDWTFLLFRIYIIEINEKYFKTWWNRNDFVLSFFRITKIEVDI